MVKFRTNLQNKLVDELLPAWVGIAASNSGANPYVKTFDRRLYSQDIENLPFVVVNVRQAEKQIMEQELGDPHGLYTYDVYIYYLDMDADWNTGDDRRNTLVEELERQFERNPRLGNVEAADSVTREYIYDLEVSSATFDSSGQEGDYSFVTELYLRVFTARSKT